MIIVNIPLRAGVVSDFVDLTRSPAGAREASGGSGVGVGVSVARSFENEVTRAFHFLVSEYGLSGPVDSEPSLVCYSGSGLRYQVRFDAAQRSVTTSVEKDVGTVRLTADLPELVVGAALGAPEKVRCGARTLTELRATVLSHAAYVRRLQPYLSELNVLPLMRAAHARELQS
jgi:hypothetical protein